MRKLSCIVLITYLLVCSLESAIADEIWVAAASNFTSTIKSISKNFEAKTGHEITLIFGATGKLYAQIKNGASFDIFFAADEERPKLLEKEGLALPNSRFTYAIGKLVLWSPWANHVDSGGNVLKEGKFKYLTIADPTLSPYGKAAQEVLLQYGVWENLQDHILRGKNVTQAAQFVKNGNAELGFVALSQIGHLGGSVWIVSEPLYTPIKQQAVLLKDKKVAREFLNFVKNDRQSKTIIRRFGYKLP